MKENKILVLTLLLCVMNGQSAVTQRKDYQVAINALDGVTLRLEALMAKAEETRNFIVSPLSAALVVGQLMLASEGEFRDELYNLLSLPTPLGGVIKSNGEIIFSEPYGLLHLQLGNLISSLKNFSSKSKTFTLENSNVMFYNTSIKLKETFQRDITRFYNTELLSVEFATNPPKCQKIINDWTAEHTKGLINTILPEPAPRTTSTIFANAIYFHGNWKTPFSYELNEEAFFKTSEDKTVKVEFMRGVVEDTPYTNSKKFKCKMISLPYEEDGLKLYMILPDKQNTFAYNITAFSMNLTSADIDEMISELKNTIVTIKVPKLNLRSTISILEPLKKYSSYIKEKNKTNRSSKINLSFKDDNLEARVVDFVNYNNPTENREIFLTNAAEGESLRLSNIFQEMTFSMNEKGTEAAAVTAGIIDYMMTESFIADHPFIFFIKHEDTGATIFWGNVVDPSQKA